MIPHRPRELHHFAMLSTSEQHSAIRRMSEQRLLQHTIASACGIAVEQVRAIVASQSTREVRRS